MEQVLLDFILPLHSAMQKTIVPQMVVLLLLDRELVRAVTLVQ